MNVVRKLCRPVVAITSLFPSDAALLKPERKKNILISFFFLLLALQPLLIVDQSDEVNHA